MNHKQLTHQQLTAQPLWKKIGKAKESIGQEFYPEAEMVTSIELDLCKVQHNIAKSRTLITEDYINNVSMAESSFIELSQRRTKETHSEGPNMKKHKNLNENIFKGVNEHILHKFLKLAVDISQLKQKYEEFCLHLLSETEQFFSRISQFVITQLKSTQFQKIYTQELEHQNRKLKIDLVRIARHLQQKTQTISFLKMQLQQKNELLGLAQKKQKKQAYQSQQYEQNEYRLARKKNFSRDKYDQQQKLVLSSVSPFEPLNLEKMKQHIDRPTIRTKKQKHSSQKFEPTLFSSQDIPKRRTRIQQMGRDLDDFLVFQEKLKSLKLEIERIK